MIQRGLTLIVGAICHKVHIVSSTDEFFSARTLICTFDSLGSSHHDVIDTIRDYLTLEAMERDVGVSKTKADGITVEVRRGNVFIPSHHRSNGLKIPHQSNGWECGYHLIHYSNLISERPTFWGHRVSEGHNRGNWAAIKWKEDELPSLSDRIRKRILGLRVEV